jgi:hypothetical protein
MIQTTTRLLAISLISTLAVLSAWPLSSMADDNDINSPKYIDAENRYVWTERVPFALPEPKADDAGPLHIHRICILDHQFVAQLTNALVSFDVATGDGYSEQFPFQIIDSACGDKAHRHLLASSWPDGRVYSIAVKTSDPWSGWRRGDPIKLLKDEEPLGYVEGEQDVRLLTNRRLLLIKGDKLSQAITLSQPIKVFALARVAIVRVNDDIYFGNDGGEWGGTLYRIDRTNGKISLAQEGNPVASIVLDPAHDGCVLVARALAHLFTTDGELMRVCHATSDTLIKHEPVWSVAGKNPIFVALSDGIGELQGDTVGNRRKFPSPDHVVAGMHYATLPGIILLSNGITQSVSTSGPVPVLVEWREEVEASH